MKNLLKYFLCCSAALLFAACSGTIDPEDGQEQGGNVVDPMQEVPDGVLRIFADKTEILADGNEVVTFTVMFGKENVSTAQTLVLIREYAGEVKRTKSADKFSTVTAGTYNFTAEYYYGGKFYTDNSVTVEAKPYFAGEAKQYKRQYFGTLFTSTGCNSCPLAANGLKKLQEANPGEILIAAFHADMTMPDPMTVAETYELKAALRGRDGLPAFYWNMRPESYTGGAAFTDSFNEEKARCETYSGVAINSSYDEAASKLDVEVCVTSNVATVFRYMIVLVEDNIPAVGEYEQNGQNQSYMHQNVVRDVLNTISSFGDKMNDQLPFTVGVEVKAAKSVTVSEDWNVENMRVIALALTSDDGGNTWAVNNAADCKLGESVSYQYAE